MALRNTDPENGKQKEGSSAVAGLAPYWNDPQKKPSIEWKKCSDLFAVAMTAKYSISMQEVLRVVTNESERNEALLNNLEHPVVERKCLSVLYLSLGTGARKTFTDKYPTIKVAEITLADLLKNCKKTFDTNEMNVGSIQVPLTKANAIRNSRIILGFSEWYGIGERFPNTNGESGLCQFHP